MYIILVYIIIIHFVVNYLINKYIIYKCTRKNFLSGTAIIFAKIAKVKSKS